MKPLRLVIADDHRIFRDGLRQLLAKKRSLSVVGEAGDGAEAVAVAAREEPDVVIMDLAMPVMDGIEATRRVKEARSEMKIIALSMHAEREFVLAALKAGADGYLLKECAFEEMMEALRTVVLHGGLYLSPAIGREILNEYVAGVAEPKKKDGLSPREEEVLRFIAEGLSTKEIAFKLELSVKTVETHRQAVMRKLDIFSVALLTRYAIRRGLINP